MLKNYNSKVWGEYNLKKENPHISTKKKKENEAAKTVFNIDNNKKHW